MGLAPPWILQGDAGCRRGGVAQAFAVGFEELLNSWPGFPPVGSKRRACTTET